MWKCDQCALLRNDLLHVHVCSTCCSSGVARWKTKANIVLCVCAMRFTATTGAKVVWRCRPFIIVVHDTRLEGVEQRQKSVLNTDWSCSLGCQWTELSVQLADSSICKPAHWSKNAFAQLWTSLLALDLVEDMLKDSSYLCHDFKCFRPWKNWDLSLL